ncbi:unnamed protein product [Rotaria sp. Silwood1]|nr:unnamed protein product [Rotaria sp. Silwood1]
MTQSKIDERSKRFLGDVLEWTVAYSNPAQVSHIYRQRINDPLRIPNDRKLKNIYYNYIHIYFENSDVMSLFERGAHENDMYHFIRAYTRSNSFNTTLNYHLAANVLFYFEFILYDTIDYQLVKCLIDFVALFIYRQELCEYIFNGTVYREVVMTEKDLFKHVVGSRIMNTSFLSTSKDKQVAEFFSEQKQHKFAVLGTYVIHNKNNRRTALDISDISCFPHEREVLILPFSAFYVKRVKRPANDSEPIEMILVEDDSNTLENIDTITLVDY